MKSIIRSILFVRRKVYIYPFSERNLDNELEKIDNSKYFSLTNDLRCKIVNATQFDIWEKWNYGIGTRGFLHMSNGNAYFSGTKISNKEETIIEALIFPNPFGTIVAYTGAFILILSFVFHDYADISLKNIKFQLIFTPVVAGMMLLLFFSRKRIQRKVEEKLNLKTYHKKNKHKSALIPLR